jgi:hypothetical protein
VQAEGPHGRRRPRAHVLGRRARYRHLFYHFLASLKRVKRERERKRERELVNLRGSCNLTVFYFNSYCFRSFAHRPSAARSVPPLSRHSSTGVHRTVVLFVWSVGGLCCFHACRDPSLISRRQTTETWSSFLPSPPSFPPGPALRCANLYR